MAMLDQFGAERAHGRVLLDAVAVRRDDDGRQPGAPAAKATLWPWLPRVAAITPATSGCRRFSSSMYTSPPRDLEGADRRVVLVLHPGLGTRALARAAASRIAASAA